MKLLVRNVDLSIVCVTRRQESSACLFRLECCETWHIAEKMSEETDTEKKLSCVKRTAVDTLNVRKGNIMTS